MSAPGAAPAGIAAALASALDYAGLFPPATLALADALANYRRYAASPGRWALGRFVVPVARLEAMEQAAPAPGILPAAIAAIGSDDFALDRRALAAYNARHLAQSAIESYEARAGSRQAIALCREAAAGLEAYCEIAPNHPELEALLEAVAEAGCRAKLRTGGITAAAIPSPDQVVRFLAICCRLRLPFKCTAGLHHALRGRHPLTYAPDAPVAVMHGYLNVMRAASALLDGATPAAARELLLASEPVTLGLAAWTPDQIARTRALFTGFGTCSFEEPLAYLPTS